MNHATTMTRRRDQRSHDVITTNAYPIVTRSLLADALAMQSSHSPSQINQPLLSLILARKAINDAHIACNAAKRAHPKNPSVRNQLDVVMRELAETMGRLPLTIV